MSSCVNLTAVQGRLSEERVSVLCVEINNQSIIEETSAAATYPLTMNAGELARDGLSFLLFMLHI